MSRIPKPANRATWLENLSPTARAFLASQVNTEQALGFAGHPGRPPVPSATAQAPASTRRDRRAHSKLETQADRLERRRRRDVRYERRFARKMTEWGALEPAGGWRGISRNVWVMSWDIVADGTGRAVRYWMSQESNKVAVGAAREAALAGGARTWSDLLARRIMALALVKLRLAERTERKGRFALLVRGVPVGALANLLAPPGASARIPHRNSISGRHRGAQSRERRGQLGYLHELERAGFCYAQQLPAAEVEPFERMGASGHATNRYWLVTPHPSDVHEQATRERLIALHRAGQSAHSEQLERPGRRGKFPAESRAQQLRAAVFGAQAHPPPE